MDGLLDCSSDAVHCDGLDESALRSVLRLYCDQGVHGVLINGTTGEWFSQTEAERRRVAEIAVEELRGKIPVVVGCTTFTPSQTIALGLHAREIGADGVLSTPPPYAAPTPREVVAFFSAVSDSVDLPIMVYNWARGVGVEITVVVQFEMGLSYGPIWAILLRSQHRVPDSRRTSIFETQSAEVELALVDAMEQFDPGDGDRGRPEPFETEHRTNAKFHAAVVLFDQVVQIFR